jgi:hypothetical protein
LIRLHRLAYSGAPAPLPASKLLVGVGIALILAGVAANEWLVARFLSTDGNLSSSTIFSIRLMQAVLMASGLSVLWRKQAVLLVALLSLAALNLYALHTTVRSTSADGRVIAVQRLRVLRDLLPSEGHVGFVSDSNAGLVAWALHDPLAGPVPEDSRERYYLTQFAVAPLVVEIGPTRRFVIVNSKATQSVAGFEVVRDLGQGLLLMRSASE